jgi:hypothetical protein
VSLSTINEGSISGIYKLEGNRNWKKKNETTKFWSNFGGGRPQNLCCCQTQNTFMHDFFGLINDKFSSENIL